MISPSRESYMHIPDVSPCVHISLSCKVFKLHLDSKSSYYFR